MLYLIGGENIYLSVLRLEELKKEFINRYNGAIQIFNADEIEDSNDILTSVDNLSIFSQYKLIIIKRLLLSKATILDKISEYLKGSNNLNIVIWEDKQLDKRRSIYKFIKKKGVIEEFRNLKYYELKSWLNIYLKTKVKFDPDIINLLIMKIGENQMQLVSILENLITLIKEEDKGKITVSDVNKFVEKTAEESIWEFIDAISSNNKPKALGIIERLLIDRTDFVMVIGMIARQFRIITLTGYLVSLGKSSKEITNILKLHPFVVHKALIHCNNFTFEKLRKLYRKLVSTDLVVKKGKFEAKLALDLLIAAV
jgi:DNA polymerase-3 subunit delta